MRSAMSAGIGASNSITVVEGMTERQPVRVQRLPRKTDRPQMIGTEDVALLADQHVAAQARLEPNLVALPRDEADFDERRVAVRLDDAVFRLGFLAARIARARFLLNQRVLVPHEMIAPGAGRRIGMAVHHRAVHALRLVALELFLQPRLRVGALGEHDES